MSQRKKKTNDKNTDTHKEIMQNSHMILWYGSIYFVGFFFVCFSVYFVIVFSLFSPFFVFLFHIVIRISFHFFFIDVCMYVLRVSILTRYSVSSACVVQQTRAYA